MKVFGTLAADGSRRRGAGRTLALGALVLGLGACANPQAEQALYAQQAFVGMPVETLLSCAGVPDRQASVDNLNYYTYSSERIVTRPAPALSTAGPFWHPWYGWSYGPRWGWGFPDTYAEVESRSCEATFTLKNGLVQQVVYNSASEGPTARLGQCYQIVENCLALVPQQTVAR